MCWQERSEEEVHVRVRVGERVGREKIKWAASSTTLLDELRLLYTLSAGRRHADSGGPRATSICTHRGFGEYYSAVLLLQRGSERQLSTSAIMGRYASRIS